MDYFQIREIGGGAENLSEKADIFFSNLRYVDDEKPQEGNAPDGVCQHEVTERGDTFASGSIHRHRARQETFDTLEAQRLACTRYRGDDGIPFVDIAHESGYVLQDATEYVVIETDGRSVGHDLHNRPWFDESRCKINLVMGREHTGELHTYNG